MVGADRQPDRGLAGDDGLGVGALQASPPDLAAPGAGPVQVGDVDRHPDREGLPGDDRARSLPSRLAWLIVPAAVFAQ